MLGKRLVVIGAGPKAMALASKVCVLREMGFGVPELHIIEKGTVGSHWTGDAGYTNGRLALGTSPEKDVGFPYNSHCWGQSYNKLVDERMGRFSWQSYLISTDSLSDWVDRGRPAPPHREWASYLKWVAAGVAGTVRIHCGEVDRVRLTPENKWAVGFRCASGRSDGIEADGIVVTGPGKIRLSEVLPIHDNVLTVESFWRTYLKFRDVGASRIAIVGTGENAAAIAMALAQVGNSQLSIEILSPSGMAFSRGESFRENRVYSNPEHGHWNRLTVADRRNFIYRTDRGVFSLYAQATLDQTDNIAVLPGRVRRVTPTAQGKLEVGVEYAGEAENRPYDYVVMATGADQLAFFRGLIDDATAGDLERMTSLSSLTQPALEPLIAEDLSVQGMRPRLHLPMLSGVAQGPGFANLSCLGRLSDRILQPYVTCP